MQINTKTEEFLYKRSGWIYLEDLEDTYIALERISDPRRVLLSTEEVLDELKNSKWNV
jgi:predicted xylose isomerase-like sugar epimerase